MKTKTWSWSEGTTKKTLAETIRNIVGLGYAIQNIVVLQWKQYSGEVFTNASEAIIITDIITPKN